MRFLMAGKVTDDSKEYAAALRACAADQWATMLVCLIHNGKMSQLWTTVYDSLLFSSASR